MRNPTQQEVVDAIDRGIRRAQADYEATYASYVFDSQYCPEYFMKVYIFQSLLRLKQDCGCAYGLSVEQPVREIIGCLPRKRGRYSKKLRMNGKCDLLIWDVEDDQKERPLIAIEVKEDIKKYSSDVNRLIGLVQRNLPFGVFTSCVFREVKSKRGTAKGESEIVQGVDSMCQRIRAYLGRLDRDLCLECSLGDLQYMQLEGDAYRLVWCPVSLVFSRKKSCRQMD